MNLPSIFKSTPVMKSGTSAAQKNNNLGFTSSGNSKADPVPNDMFGLGIQVFKIQSRKQIAPGSNTNAKSVGKATKTRQEFQAAQNPRRISNMPPVPLPKNKKTSAILPSINKTPSQKQYKIEAINTDSILGRKSADKYKHTQNLTNFDPIQQQAVRGNIARNPASKNKTFVVSSRAAVNKSSDGVPQNLAQSTSQPIIRPIYKQQWRPSLNSLRNFYTQLAEFKNNQLTKLGRRKNQDYLQTHSIPQTNIEGANCSNFIDAYITNLQETQGKYFSHDFELYDPDCIQNWSFEDGKFLIKDHKYEEHTVI